MPEELFGNIAVSTVIIIVSTCACIFSIMAIIFGSIWLWNRRTKRKAEALMATGQQGEATVLSLEDTGVLVNNNPRVRIGLEVRIPGHPAYKVVKTMTMPMIRMSQVQVGSVVKVLADPSEPANPDKVGLLLA